MKQILIIPILQVRKLRHKKRSYMPKDTQLMSGIGLQHWITELIHSLCPLQHATFHVLWTVRPKSLLSIPLFHSHLHSLLSVSQYFST